MAVDKSTIQDDHRSKNEVKAAKKQEGEKFLGTPLDIGILRALDVQRSKYAKSVPIDAIVPPVGDLMDFEPMKQVIAVLHGGKLPGMNMATISNNADDGLPAFVQQWRLEKDKELLRIMGAPVSEENSQCDFTPLYLATTIFSCNQISEDHPECLMVSYPRILVHSGATTLNPEDFNNIPTESNLDINDWKWNGHGRITFNMEAHEIAKNLVSICGLNPATATFTDMDTLDPIFACNNCKQDTLDFRCCMRWKDAIYHALSMCRTSTLSTPRFNMITDFSVIRDAKTLLRNVKMATHPLVCIYCRAEGSGSLFREHVLNMHGRSGVSDIVLGRDCVVSTDFDSLGDFVLF